MSDDSSSEEAMAPKAKAKAAGKSAVESDDSSDEVVSAPKPKAKAKGQPAVDSDDSSEEEVVAPKAKATGKPTAETDSEDESVPAKHAPKVQVATLGDSDDSDDSDVADRAQATHKIAQQSKVVEAASDDSDDSDAELPPKLQAAKGPSKNNGTDVVKHKAKLDAASKTPKQGASTSSKLKGEDDTDDLRVFVAGIPWKVQEDELKKYFQTCGDVQNVKILLNEEQKPKGCAFITFKTPEGAKAALKEDGNKEQFRGRTLKVERAKKQVVSAKGKEGTKTSKDGKSKGGEKSSNAPDAQEPSTHDIITAKVLTKLKRAQEAKDFNALVGMGEKIARRAKAARAEHENMKKAKERKEDTPCVVFVSGLPEQDFSEDDFRRRFEDCGSIKWLWYPVKQNGHSRGIGKIAYKNEEGFEKALKYNGTKCKGNLLRVVKSQPKKPENKAAQADDAKDKSTSGEKSKRKEGTAEGAAEEAREDKSKRKSGSVDENTAEDTRRKKERKEEKAEEKSKRKAAESIAEQGASEANKKRKMPPEEEVAVKKKDKKDKKSAK